MDTLVNCAACGKEISLADAANYDDETFYCYDCDSRLSEAELAETR